MEAEMKEEEGEECPNSPLAIEFTLRRASERINGLISSSYFTKSFPLKWQSIRAKLEQLNFGLTAAIGGNDSIEKLALVEVLQVIISTVSETQVLAHQCSDGSYNGGKLQLRSNLDVANCKLELHLKHLAEIYAAGMLLPSQDTVPSRPGIGASRDDMRLYVKDLFSRLRIGNSEMRTKALAALNEILSEDEKYVKIIAIDIDDGISLLLSLLEFKNANIQEAAVEAIAVISSVDSYKGALIAGGVIEQLIRVLERGSEFSREKAARALERLTENSDCSWSVSAHGGITVLLKICSNDKSRDELVGLACRILRNLSGDAGIKGFMVEEGLISVLSKLLRSKEEVSQIQAIEFLHHLAAEDETITRKMIKEGITDSLVQVLDPNTLYLSKAREIALRAIEGLYFSSPCMLNVLMDSGFLELLLFFLRNGEISIQESALKMVSRLCEVSDDIKKVMGDLRFMPELVKLLENKSSEVQEMAAEALYKLVLFQRNRRRLLQEHKSINEILQLLDSEGEISVTNKYLLQVLVLLTDSAEGRRKIVASVSVQKLEKLAKKDVGDAKKIIKKLSSNKFQSMISGIWSS